MTTTQQTIHNESPAPSSPPKRRRRANAFHVEEEFEQVIDVSGPPLTPRKPMFVKEEDLIHTTSQSGPI